MKMKVIDFSSFETIKFPLFPDIVYVLGLEPHGCFVPFYVGKTSRHVGRLGDYIRAQFTASTDFKVGEAVKYLRQKGYEVLCKFKESKDMRKDEDELISTCKRQQYLLLNDLGGYDYKTANRDEECKRIQDYVDRIVSSAKN